MPAPEQHYKKTYLKRKAQEIEAEEEIKAYDGSVPIFPTPTPEVSYSQDMDAEG